MNPPQKCIKKWLAIGAFLQKTLCIVNDIVYNKLEDGREDNSIKSS